ncbi:hypothetical protein PDE_06106 [Penicillium oxalicum 114-2]|uniref:Methyltransferase domain-containing protein n=1 Tax=Penicillium oxalicum (strain 114-2 / CGMCC 5302) TaxID=933388 RepID=S7ZR61_PENO1|nr:hypothetical protein PDE_06106 [Penicillium oxalicum 114-2]
MLGFLKKSLESRVYGLDHAVLNIQLPPATMWMNMGYWKDTEDFPKACQALLDQVLKAGLREEDRSQSRSLSILDVGCGCGDQSIHIASLRKSRPSSTSNSTRISESTSHSVHESAGPVVQQRVAGAESSAGPLVDVYVGITLQPSQAELGQQRIRVHHQRQNSLGKRGVDEVKANNNDNDNDNLNDSLSNYNIFCADAANPSTWTGDLHTSMTKIIRTSTPLKSNSSRPSSSSSLSSSSTWLLALDTMYHFQPSRLPILHYANTTLHASFMAFDLLLADQTSFWQRLKLRLVCWITGTPFANFLTRDEYLRLLVEAGYDRDRVEIVDISRDVFPGITKFLGRRIREGQPFGLNLGKFRGARMVFGWWARSGIVRGVVVVARK